MAIFEEVVQVAETLGDTDEKLKFITGAKKEELDKYENIIDELKKQKISEKQFDRLMQQPKEGQAIAGSADPLQGAFSGEQGLTQEV